jgi:hypothetical protein
VLHYFGSQPSSTGLIHLHLLCLVTYLTFSQFHFKIPNWGYSSWCFSATNLNDHRL